jgi:hypothetical protein
LVVRSHGLLFVMDSNELDFPTRRPALDVIHDGPIAVGLDQPVSD